MKVFVISDIEGVAGIVKWLPGAARHRRRGLGRFSARQHPAPAARELIEVGARQALADLNAVAPYDPGSPCEITVDFNTFDHVERYRFRPGVEITKPRQIVSRADDWWTAWRQFFF